MIARRSCGLDYTVHVFLAHKVSRMLYASMDVRFGQDLRVHVCLTILLRLGSSHNLASTARTSDDG